MGWHRPDEESRADHYRDTRKHEPLPCDPPLCVQRDLSPAEDVIAFIKQTDNYAECVEALEDFAASERERIRLDAVAAGSNA